MNYLKIIISILGIILIGFFANKLHNQTDQEKELKKTQKVFKADILDLSCGTSKDFIKFEFRNKRIRQRIYLSSDECNDLRNKSMIDIKIDRKGNIVFANDNYNDSTEMEGLAIILLAGFLMFCVFYYFILPEMKK